jgi:octaprenyl-diphosphate synthase
MQPELIKSVSCAYGLIEDDLRKVQLLIDEQIASKNPAVDDVLAYIRMHPGKMLRPALVLLSGKCCGTINPIHLEIAAIVELIHIVTLLHDDVIDESDQRRGHKTVNNEYGNEAAVLSGDYLFSKVFKLCANLSEQNIGKILADTCIRICQGELEQNFHRRNWELSEDDYIKIITEKSASFMASCCYLGAFAAGAETARSGLFAEFGLNVGIAFQIIDDVLDFDGNEEIMGKCAGSDFNMDKLTLPIIHLLSNSDENRRQDILKALTENKQSRNTLLCQNGCLKYARNRAGDFHKIAIEAISKMPQTPAKAAIIETADFCLNRVG